MIQQVTNLKRAHEFKIAAEPLGTHKKSLGILSGGGARRTR
jgi:hypothetical protein